MGRWRDTWHRLADSGLQGSHRGRTAFIPPDGLPPDQLLRLHRTVLDVLCNSEESPGLEAWIDPLSDCPWPEHVLGALTHIRGLANKPDSIAIDVDLADSADREAFLAISPYTINAEVWSEKTTLVLSASDTGTGTYAELTESENAAIQADLRAHGLDGLLSPMPERRRWWNRG